MSTTILPPTADIETPWMLVARAELGTRERLPNGKPNPRIAEYFQSTGFKGGDADDAWCSAFANWVMARVWSDTDGDPALHGTGKANARSWLDWGRPIERWQYGCIAIYSRPPKPGSGHVHFVVSETPGYLRGLGGNQNNRVCIKQYPEARLLGLRMPAV